MQLKLQMYNGFPSFVIRVLQAFSDVLIVLHLHHLTSLVQTTIPSYALTNYDQLVHQTPKVGAAEVEVMERRLYCLDCSARGFFILIAGVAGVRRRKRKKRKRKRPRKKRRKKRIKRRRRGRRKRKRRR